MESAETLDTSAAIAFAASRYESGASPSDAINLEEPEEEGDGTRIVTVSAMPSDIPMMSLVLATNKYACLCPLYIEEMVLV